MSALSIQVPFPVFQDRDGQPLDNGYVWLGTSSLNPQTNPVVAYYDSALTIVATQPLRTLNGFISRAGSPAQVYVDAVNFSILVQDSKGTTVFSVPEGTGISPNASGVVYDPAGTGAVATTVQAKLRESDSILDKGTGTAADLSEAMASLTSGGEILIPKGAYTFSGSITCSNAHVTVRCADGVTISWSGLGANVSAIVAAANNFTWIGGVITGPSSAAYVANENFIKMIGTSTSVRKFGLTVKNAEILNFGGHGIYAQFVDRVNVSENYIHDIGYAGAMFLSCDNGSLVRNTVSNITPGVTSNMYGLSLTHDSTGYVGGGKSATNPFCRGWLVTGNEVSNINWEGIDTHGCYEVQVLANRVYATKLGIALTSSSGAAVAYAGHQNVCIGNIVDGRNRDGTTSGYENLGYGINLNGGSTTHQLDVICTGNIVSYKGVVSTFGGCIQASYVDRGIIANNTIDFWGGNGIYYALSNLTISGNIIGQAVSAGDTYRNCIFDDNGTMPATIIGNMHVPLAGTVALVGFKQSSGATKRPRLIGNDFLLATTAYAVSSTSTNFVFGTDVTNYVVESAGSATPSVAGLSSPGVVYLTNAGTYDITNLTGAAEGQIVLLENGGSGTITFTRANSRLDGGTSKVLGAYDTLMLKYSGSQWIQLAYAQNN